MRIWSGRSSLLLLPRLEPTDFGFFNDFRTFDPVDEDSLFIPPSSFFKERHRDEDKGDCS